MARASQAEKTKVQWIKGNSSQQQRVAYSQNAKATTQVGKSGNTTTKKGRGLAVAAKPPKLTAWQKKMAMALEQINKDKNAEHRRQDALQLMRLKKSIIAKDKQLAILISTPVEDLVAATKKKIANVKLKKVVIDGYHRTSHNITPELISLQGFHHEESNPSSGALYGIGWYMNRDLPSINSRRSVETYGPVVVKCRADLAKYLIFDADLATKVYGRARTILEQFVLHDVPLPCVWRDAAKNILYHAPIMPSSKSKVRYAKDGTGAVRIVGDTNKDGVVDLVGDAVSAQLAQKIAVDLKVTLHINPRFCELLANGKTTKKGEKWYSAVLAREIVEFENCHKGSSLDYMYSTKRGIENFRTFFGNVDSNKYVSLLGFNGIAYTGKQDRKCMVAYNFDSVAPVAWQEGHLYFSRSIDPLGSLKKPSIKSFALKDDKWQPIKNRFGKNSLDKRKRIHNMLKEWVEIYSTEKAMDKCNRFITLSKTPANFIALFKELRSMVYFDNSNPTSEQREYRALLTKFMNNGLSTEAVNHLFTFYINETFYGLIYEINTRSYTHRFYNKNNTSSFLDLWKTINEVSSVNERTVAAIQPLTKQLRLAALDLLDPIAEQVQRNFVELWKKYSKGATDKKMLMVLAFMNNQITAYKAACQNTVNYYGASKCSNGYWQLNSCKDSRNQNNYSYNLSKIQNTITYRILHKNPYIERMRIRLDKHAENMRKFLLEEVYTNPQVANNTGLMKIVMRMASETFIGINEYNDIF